MILFLVLVSVSYADPSVSGLVVGDADGILEFGTIYNFNVTVSGISNGSCSY